MCKPGETSVGSDDVFGGCEAKQTRRPVRLIGAERMLVPPQQIEYTIHMFEGFSAPT